MGVAVGVRSPHGQADADEPRIVEVREPWWIAAWASVAVGTVLRAWGLGSHDLTFDEAYTGTAARRDLGSLLEHLRTADTHPPLDYVLRMPFAESSSELLLRVPSLVWSVATLVVLARWMRPKGAFGALVVIVASVAPFLVLHGREARMYALVMLLGVVAGMFAERWLAEPTGRSAAIVAVAGGLAVLSHSAALAPVGLLVCLPGLRRDRQAWRFRLAILASLLAWAVAWGSAFVDQATGIGSFWIPLTSLDWVETVAAAVVSPRAALAHLSALLLAIGTALVVLRQPRTGRVALLAFVAPFAALTLLGFELHVLLPRSFAFGAWVPVMALAAIVEESRRRIGVVGSALSLIVLAMVLVPSSLEIVEEPRERHVALDELRTRLEPGDRISISPTYFRPVIGWEFGSEGYRVEGVEDGRFVLVDGEVPPSGRVHLLDHSRLPIAGDPMGSGNSCGEELRTSSWLLRCVQETDR